MKQFLFPAVCVAVATWGITILAMRAFPVTVEEPLLTIEEPLAPGEAAKFDEMWKKIQALEAELDLHKEETLRFAKTATAAAAAITDLNQQQSVYIVDLKRECMLLRHKQSGIQTGATPMTDDPGYGSDPPVVGPDEYGRAIRQAGYTEELDKWKKALDDCSLPKPEPEPQASRGCGQAVRQVSGRQVVFIGRFGEPFFQPGFNAFNSPFGFHSRVQRFRRFP